MEFSRHDWRRRVYQGYVHEREVAAAPSSTTGFGSRSVWLNHFVKQFLPSSPESPILEVGCGHGALIHFARCNGFTNIRGTDASPAQVAAASKLGIHGVQQRDALDTLRNEETNSLAAVIAFDVIEHLTHEELFDFLAEVHRTLRPGGRIILHTVNGSSPFQGDSRYNDITHTLAFTRNSMGQVLSISGFQQFGFHEDAPVVHGMLSGIRWLAWKVIRGGLRIYNLIETGDRGGNAIFSRNFTIVASK